MYRAVTDARPTGMARVHALIFSLLYPGLLAAFILSQFTQAARIEGFAPWGWLLCLYFAVQFVEGHETKAHYPGGRAVLTMFEMAGMMLIFAALGYFPDLEAGGALRSPELIGAMMAAVFALPALYRIIVSGAALRKGQRGYLFARTITIMSLLAAFLSGFFAAEPWAWGTVLVMLAVYMFAFQFGNDWLVDRLATGRGAWLADFRRP